jgi:hypothetical protein
LKPKTLKTFVIDTLWIARKRKNKDNGVQSLLGKKKKKKPLKIDACFIISQDSL